MNKTLEGYGYIRERKNKSGTITYQVAAYYGKDLVGKSRYKYSSAKTYEEAEAILEKMVAKIILNKTMASGGKNITLQRFIDDEFLPLYCAKNKPSTIKSYTQMSKYITASPISKKSLESIATSNLQAFFNSLYEQSTLSKEGLSHRTITDIRRFLHLVFEQAIACNYLENNPCKGTKLKKITTSATDLSKEVYNFEELKALMKAVKGTDLECLICLILECGLRRGEAVAIQYDDFNDEDGTITIQRNAVEDVNGATVLVDPKTISSRRTVQLSDYCQKKLKESRNEYRQLRLRLGPDFVNSGCILHNANGGMMTAHALTTKWNRFTKANNLRHIKLHGLRKTAATTMLKQGMDIKAVSGRLGHKNVSITLDIYTAIDDDIKAKNVELMENMFQSVVNQ